MTLLKVQEHKFPSVWGDTAGKNTGSVREEVHNAP